MKLIRRKKLDIKLSNVHHNAVLYSEFGSLTCNQAQLAVLSPYLKHLIDKTTHHGMVEIVLADISLTDFDVLRRLIRFKAGDQQVFTEVPEIFKLLQIDLLTPTASKQTDAAGVNEGHMDTNFTEVDNGAEIYDDDQIDNDDDDGSDEILAETDDNLLKRQVLSLQSGGGVATENIKEEGMNLSIGDDNPSTDFVVADTFTCEETSDEETDSDETESEDGSVSEAKPGSSAPSVPKPSNISTHEEGKSVSTGTKSRNYREENSLKTLRTNVNRLGILLAQPNVTGVCYGFQRKSYGTWAPKLYRGGNIPENWIIFNKDKTTNAQGRQMQAGLSLHKVSHAQRPNKKEMAFNQIKRRANTIVNVLKKNKDILRGGFLVVRTESKTMIYEPPPDDKSAFALNKRNISGVSKIIKLHPQSPMEKGEWTPTTLNAARK